MKKQVRCKSGVYGWQDRLQNVYDSLEEFESYCETYSIHLRLGYTIPLVLWLENPVIRGSVYPDDLEYVER